MLSTSSNIYAGVVSEKSLDELSDLPISFSAPRRKRIKLFHSLTQSVLRSPISFWGFLDSAAAFALFFLAHRFSIQFNFTLQHGYRVGVAAAVFSVLLLCICYAQGLYDRHNLSSLAFIIRAAVIANLLAIAGTSVGFSWFKFVNIGRFILLYTFMMSTMSIVLIRLLVRATARSAKVCIMFVGTRSKFRPLECELRHRFRGFYSRPVYFEMPGDPSVDREKLLLQAIRRADPDEIVVEDNNRLIFDVMSHSATILDLGCEVRSHTAYFEELLRQVPVESMDHRAMLGTGLNNNRYGTHLSKRLLDICLAVFGLLIAAPIMLAIAAIMKVCDPGPIIYKQTRVGRYGRLFSIYKFRTMRIDAEKNGAVWAKSRDSRVTKLGRFLRGSRLDELPQLWNILRSDMSFVGPRPERPEFVNELREKIPHYDLRHLVPPGLTGWAQVRYRYGASVEDAQRKLAFDLYYVRRYSPSFDLAICLRTVVAMAKGAR